MTYQWNFFSASLDPVQGSGRAGKRPVLVVSRERINRILPIVNVIPITSVKSPNRVIYPNEVLLSVGVDGLTTDSIALCYQVRTLDKTRLEKHLGELTDTTLRMQIQSALRFQLEL